MKVCKLSVCKQPTLYQSVHENACESLLHSLFLHKTIQLSPFDLQSTAPLSAILQTGDIYPLVYKLKYTKLLGSQCTFIVYKLELIMHWLL